MSCPETSADGLVVGAGVGASDVFHWEKILASFIAHSSAALSDTDEYNMVCLLSGLSPAIYSALLLEELLDKVHKMCNDVGMGLKLWDGGLASIHVNDYEKTTAERHRIELIKQWHTREAWVLVSLQKCTEWKCMS
jgi:hypothetical protein